MIELIAAILGGASIALAWLSGWYFGQAKGRREMRHQLGLYAPGERQP